MTDSSEIGHFGTLRLLKRNDPSTTIAFFPIDDEEVTFGRSSKCSVRLYYAFVSELHCILRISEERKAFLVVKGANGVVIDGCEVVPTPGKDTTVPLINGSEIEIHKKTFRFEYPPKEVRAALLFTPRTVKKSRRSLRMSMIASAQVFTPQKSSPIKMPLRTSRLRDEEEQWVALRSPVKVCSEEKETLLIEGAGEDTVVVEEEKDLIILEHIEEQPEAIELSATPPPPNSQTTTPKLDDKPQGLPLPPRGFKTPPSRRKSGLSLHRAVVLRSAHRAYLEQERQRVFEQLENEHEEEEVELAVSPERDLGPFELGGDADNDNNEVGQPFGEEVYDYEEDEEGDDQDDNVDNEELQEMEELEDEIVPNIVPLSPHAARPYSGALETIKAGFSVVKKLTYEKSPECVPLPTEDEDIKHKKVTDSCRYTKPFMTPQPLFKRAQRVPMDVKPRQTLAGGELFPLFGGARRVPRESVRDSVVETPSGSSETQAKPQITEEERQAIMERRRSALQMPTMLPPPRPRNINHVDEEEKYVPGQNNEDTETMLERMKMKLETVRRKSEVRMARLSHVSPQKDIGYSMVSSPSLWRNEPKSRTLRIAEESLRQMKLEDNDEEQSNRVTTPIRQKSSFPHLRFETVREITSGPHNEPQTPALTGMKMFNTMPISGTPSFVGIKEMYKVAPVPTTPIMRLDEMFMEVEEHDVGEESGERSRKLHDLKAVKPTGENTISRLPTRKGWGRKRATPTICEVIDVDAQTTQPVKQMVTKAVEPLVEVQNSREHIENDEQNPPRRITRSRGAKTIADDIKTVEEPKKRATRQIKKQQTNTTTEESPKVRRGRTKQLVEQVKKEETTEAVPKPTTRRKPRLNLKLKLCTLRTRSTAYHSSIFPSMPKYEARTSVK